LTVLIDDVAFGRPVVALCLLRLAPAVKGAVHDQSVVWHFRIVGEAMRYWSLSWAP